MSRLALILVACLLAAAAWLALRGDEARGPGAAANRATPEPGEPSSSDARLAVPPAFGEDATSFERVPSAPSAVPSAAGAPDAHAEQPPAESILVATLFDAAGSPLASERITYEVSGSAAPRLNPPRELDQAATTDGHGRVELPYDARALAAKAAAHAGLPGELHRVKRSEFGPEIEVYVGPAIDGPVTTQAAWELGPDAPHREPGSLGRLRLAFAPEKEANAPASPPPPSLHADVVLPAALAGEVFDVGSIRLLPLPRIVAGHVLDEVGAPIAGASVSARRATGAHVGMHVARTDANGAFELRAATLDDPVARADDGIELSLEAVAAGYVQREAASAGPGDARVVVVLARAGALDARLVLPDGVAPRSIALRARPGNAAPDDPWFAGGVARESAPGEVHGRAADGAVRYAIPSLPVGAHVLEVRLVGPHPPLAVLDGVEAFATPEGSPARAVALDPRLDPLDLRGRVATVALQPRGADGEPLSNYHVYFRATPAPTGPPIDEQDDAGGDARWLGRVGSAGPTHLTVVGEALDVEISAPRHRRLLLRGVRGVQEPALEPGYALVLEPDAGLRQLVALGLGGELLEETRSPEHPNHIDLGVDAQGNGVAVVCAPGPHPLRLRILRGRTSVPVACTPSEIDVRDVSGEQRIAVGIDVAELERVLTELERLSDARDGEADDGSIRIELGGF